MDLVNELAKVEDGTVTTQRKSDQILKEIAASKRKKKDSQRGKVIATYFSAIEIAKIEKRADQGGLTFSGLVHEGFMRWMNKLDEEDGVLVAKANGEEISSQLTAQSQQRLGDLDKLINDYKEAIDKKEAVDGQVEG